MRLGPMRSSRPTGPLPTSISTPAALVRPAGSERVPASLVPSPEVKWISLFVKCDGPNETGVLCGSGAAGAGDAVEDVCFCSVMIKFWAGTSTSSTMYVVGSYHSTNATGPLIERCASPAPSFVGRVGLSFAFVKGVANPATGTTAVIAFWPNICAGRSKAPDCNAPSSMAKLVVLGARLKGKVWPLACSLAALPLNVTDAGTFAPPGNPYTASYLVGRRSEESCMSAVVVAVPCMPLAVSVSLTSTPPALRLTTTVDCKMGWEPIIPW